MQEEDASPSVDDYADEELEAAMAEMAAAMVRCGACDGCVVTTVLQRRGVCVVLVTGFVIAPIFTGGPRRGGGGTGTGQPAAAGVPWDHPHPGTRQFLFEPFDVLHNVEAFVMSYTPFSSQDWGMVAVLRRQVSQGGFGAIHIGMVPAMDPCGCYAIKTALTVRVSVMLQAVCLLSCHAQCGAASCIASPCSRNRREQQRA